MYDPTLTTWSWLDTSYSRLLSRDGYLPCMTSRPSHWLHLVRRLRSSSGSDFFDPVSPSEVEESVSLSTKVTSEEEKWVLLFFLSFCWGSSFHDFMLRRRRRPPRAGDPLFESWDEDCVSDWNCSVMWSPFHSISSLTFLAVALLTDLTGGFELAIWMYTFFVRMFISALDWESRSKLFIIIVFRVPWRIISNNFV